jgi:adenylylsulfate kinase-like enzyme
MGKNSGNGSENASGATQPTVHLVLQGKGGIGKSVVASWLTEFLTTRGQKGLRD